MPSSKLQDPKESPIFLSNKISPQFLVNARKGKLHRSKLKLENYSSVFSPFSPDLLEK